MNLSKEIKITIVVIMQILVILTIAIYKNSISTTGREVFLQIAPVDPRDYLRGDYVTFRYQEISSIDLSRFNYEPVVGDVVYVPLIDEGYRGLWRLNYYGSISKKKELSSNYNYGTFAKADETVFLKGVVKNVNSVSGNDIFEPGFPTRRINTNSGTVTIEYKNLEQYFIPEGTGQNFNFGGKNAVAKVAVDESGDAVLKQLYIDDKPWP